MQIFDEKKLPDSDTYYTGENIYQKSPRLRVKLHSPNLSLHQHPISHKFT